MSTLDLQRRGRIHGCRQQRTSCMEMLGMTYHHLQPHLGNTGQVDMLSRQHR